jgi:hypothetical protein
MSTWFAEESDDNREDSREVAERCYRRWIRLIGIILSKNGRISEGRVFGNKIGTPMTGYRSHQSGSSPPL